MARTRTVAQMITEARYRGDLRAARHSDTNMTLILNDAQHEFFRLVVEANPDFWTDTEDITIVAGTGDYALASDYYKSLGADVLEGSKYYSLKRLNWAARNRLQDSQSKRDAQYLVRDGRMYIRPVPTWSGTVRHGYIPILGELDDTADTFDGIAGFELFLIYSAVIAAKLRDEEDARTFVALKQQLIKEIKAQTAQRDRGEPQRVRDVHSENAANTLEVFQ